MYSFRMVYNDDRKLELEINDVDYHDFVSSLQQKRPYFCEKEGVGFWLPPENIRYAIIRKLNENPQEPCQKQKIVSLEADNASIS